MKKFITEGFRFTIICMCSYLILLLFVGRFAPAALKPNLKYRKGSTGHLYTRLQQLDTTKPVDILFLGSSHTYRGFDNRIFAKAGYSSFNLGSSSQTPLQTEVLLERYLDKLKPKLVVYEVYAELFSNDGIESALDVISNDQNDVYSVNMALDLNHIKVFNTLIYAEMVELLGIDKDFAEPLEKEGDRYIPGGFIEKEMAYFSDTVTYDPHNLAMIPMQEESFHNIVETLEDKDIKVLLVNAPITSKKYKSYRNSDEINEKLSAYGTYYDFNQLLSLNDTTDFFDADHLNQEGVNKFNNSLLTIINQDSLTY